MSIMNFNQSHQTDIGEFAFDVCSVCVCEPCGFDLTCTFLFLFGASTPSWCVSQICYIHIGKCVKC